MGSRSTPAPNADARRATSRQRPRRRLRLADGSLARISRNAGLDLATDRICMCWRGDRITCVRWPADSTTLFCIMRRSPTGHCARRRWLRDLSRSRLLIQRRELAMASLLFTCPQTHQKAPTGVETDAQSLRASWKATLKVDCPYCGALHEIAVREAYLDSAIHAATDRLDRV